MPFFDSEIETKLVELEILVREMQTAESPIQLINQLDTLQTAQRHLHGKVSEVQNYRESAIYSLPNEILAAIFDFGQPTVPNKRNSNKHQTALYPVLVSHVSRRWRIVATRASCLWSRIAAVELYPLLLRLYLERSGTRSLDICLNFDDSGSSTRWWMAKGLPLLNSHVARWHSLLITGCNLRMLHTLNSFRTLCAPRLHSIHIDVGYQESRDLDFSPLHIFTGGAAALTSVRVDGLSLYYCCPPLQAVLRLELLETRMPGVLSETVDIETFREWLSTTASLQHLAVNPNHFCYDVGVEPIEVPTILSIEFALTKNQLCNFSNLAEFCATINMPSVTSLILTGFVPYEMDRFVNILRAQQPKFVVLESLELRQSGVTEPIAFPSVLPNIKELILTCSECNILLQDLCIQMPLTSSSAAATIPWPDLDSITITPVTDDEICLLCDFVSSRAAIGYPLRCVKLSSFACISADKLQWLCEQVEVEACGSE
jgi:hypothetical protein